MGKEERTKAVEFLAAEISSFNNVRLTKFKHYIDEEKKTLETKGIIINSILGMSLAILLFYSWMGPSLGIFILFSICTTISYAARLNNEAFIHGANLLQALSSCEIRKRSSDERARKDFGNSSLQRTREEHSEEQDKEA